MNRPKNVFVLVVVVALLNAAAGQAIAQSKTFADFAKATSATAMLNAGTTKGKAEAARATVFKKLDDLTKEYCGLAYKMTDTARENADKWTAQAQTQLADGDFFQWIGDGAVSNGATQIASGNLYYAKAEWQKATDAYYASISSFGMAISIGYMQSQPCYDNVADTLIFLDAVLYFYR